jgi:dCMP deaminase
MKSTLSLKKSILFTTLSPCVQCAKLIINAGVKKVYYIEEYSCSEGIKLLKKHKVKTYKYENK